MNEQWVIVLHPRSPWELHEFERCHPSRVAETVDAYKGENRGWLIFVEDGSKEFDREGARRRLDELKNESERQKLAESGQAL